MRVSTCIGMLCVEGTSYKNETAHDGQVIEVLKDVQVGHGGPLHIASERGVSCEL
jgi:hypothetical protein